MHACILRQKVVGTDISLTGIRTRTSRQAFGQTATSGHGIRTVQVRQGLTSVHKCGFGRTEKVSHPASAGCGTGAGSPVDIPMYSHERHRQLHLVQVSVCGIFSSPQPLLLSILNCYYPAFMLFSVCLTTLRFLTLFFWSFSALLVLSTTST